MRQSCMHPTQIRVHTTHGTDLYLRVASNPIVEHCTTVRFAPYAFSFPGAACARTAQFPGFMAPAPHAG